MIRGVPPADVLRAVADLLGAPSPGAFEFTPIGGGCIHPACRIDMRVDRPAGASASGASAPFFLKWNPEPGPSGFGVEARGLRALGAAGGLRVPEVLGWADAPHGWLLLEYIESGTPAPDTPTRLGAGLAHLHRTIPGGLPGWNEDGWIGSLPQTNRGPAEWPDYWRAARLVPQWERAQSRFPTSAIDRWEHLMERMDDALREWETDGISLLHGDLWSGNAIVGPEGEPVVVDPAVYRGHREVDLAMMELFGGFGQGVFRAYGAGAPIAPEYMALRRDVYQLYPLLVHVNLFGSSYVPGVTERVERVLAELG